MTLKIEEGRYYQNRQGDIVGPMTFHTDLPYWNALYYGPRAGKREKYLETGQYADSKDNESPLDLVRVVDAPDVPDTPVPIEAEAPFKIQVGKYYKTRLGDIVGPMTRFVGIDTGWDDPFRTAYEGDCKGRCWVYCEDGKRMNGFLDGEDSLDLVEEAPAPDEPAPEPFKIQVGKYYKNRQGDIVGPVRSTSEWIFPVSTPFYAYHLRGGGPAFHQEDGSWAGRTNPTSSLDLIEEVPAPKDLAETTEAPETTRDPVSAIIEDRGRVYGDARTSFGRIAGLWNAYAGLNLTRHDVAMMLSLLKVSRIHGAPEHADSYLDAKAYLELAERISEEDEEDY